MTLLVYSSAMRGTTKIGSGLHFLPCSRMVPSEMRSEWW